MVGSAIDMLKAAGIEFKRLEKVSHEDMTSQLFGLSKQIVHYEADSEMHFYNYLEELEFIEFFARIADEVFHLSLHKSKSVCRKTREVAILPLETKIFELLVTYFRPALNITVEGQENVWDFSSEDNENSDGEIKE